MIKLDVYTDGGARGNPGPAAIGFVVIKDNKLLHQEGEYIGTATNNVAEYTAVLKALTWIKNNNIFSQYQLEEIDFYLDSQLVAEQLSGRYKIKNVTLADLVYRISSLQKQIDLKLTFHKIPRSQNARADMLVNTALNNLKL